MQYGKIENEEVIFFKDKYIVQTKEVTRRNPKTFKLETIEEEFKIYNPSDDELLKAGWYPIEYINEIGEPKIENNKLKIYTHKESIFNIDTLKQEMQSRIDAYDTSSAVNGFYLNDKELWADKVTRMGLVNAAQAAKALGNETVSFGIQGFSLTLPCDQCIQMLYALEMYALACYNVTLNHKNTVDSLDNIEDIDAYDYTVGYPTKLNFEV